MKVILNNEDKAVGLVLLDDSDMVKKFTCIDRDKLKDAVKVMAGFDPTEYEVGILEHPPFGNALLFLPKTNPGTAIMIAPLVDDEEDPRPEKPLDEFHCEDGTCIPDEIPTTIPTTEPTEVPTTEPTEPPITDPCENVTCPEGYYCDGGTCFPIELFCPPGYHEKNEARE